MAITEMMSGMETGEANDGGFLKIYTVSLYWREEYYFSVFLGYST